MTTTIVETPIARKITVVKHSHGSVNLAVKDTDLDKEIHTHLDQEYVTKLAEALLGENATVITDLPEAKEDGFGYVAAGSYDRSHNADPETVLKNAKALLAIHKFLVEKKAEEATKAEEAAKIAEQEAIVKRDKRRAELIVEFRSCSWERLTRPAKEAYDRIIDLELEAAQA